MSNGMERLGALMQGQLPDRVPVSCVLLEQGAREMNMPIKEYYSKGDYVAEGQLRLRNKYDYDTVQGFFYAGQTAELLGCRNIIFADNGPPNVGHMVIQKFEDIETFEVPETILDHPKFSELKKCIGILKQEAGGKYPVNCNVISSFSLPAILMGIDKWFELLHNGPVELRDQLLQKLATFNQNLVYALRAAGADVISYSNPYASKDMVPYDMIQDIAISAIMGDLEGVDPSGMIYFNAGARINPVIDLLIEKTPFRAFYINPFDDPAEAKKIIAGRGISSGVINDILLVDWSKDQIIEDVKRIMKAGAEGGGFVFGTLVMPFAIPEDNIKTLVEAAHQYGVY